MANPYSQLDQYKGESMTTVVTHLEERIIALEEFVAWDEALRKDHPALQDLFEKYQLTKRLLVK